MAFWKNIPGSVQAAILITAGVVLYFALSMTLRGGGNDIVEAGEERAFRVVTETLEPSRAAQTVDMRGRTAARRLVVVRAETPGQVRATPAPKGQFVDRGAVLCALDIDTRSATLDEAQAAYEKARIDFEAAQELTEKGFGSNAALAAAKAGFDQAEAALTRARTDLDKTSVRAPFAGVLQEQSAEAGDFLSVGAPCATLAELDPIRIRGAIAEKDIGAIREGDSAEVTLATGLSFPARVSYVAAAANDTTRTYAIELEAENPGSVRAGQTASVEIETGTANGWLLPHDVLVTRDDGTTGVRTVSRTGDTTGTVNFVAVTVIGDTLEGFRVTGLEGSPEVIVRGQNYVRSGQQIEIAAPGESYSNTAGKDGSTG